MLFSFFKATLASVETEKVNIRFEGRVSIDSVQSEFFEKLKVANRRSSREKTVIVDLSEAEFIYPSAVLLFASLAKQFEKQGRSIEFDVKTGSQIHEYFDYCGACAAFNIPSFPSNSVRTLDSKVNVFRVNRGSEISHSYNMALKLVDLIKDIQPLSGKVEADLIDSIDEVLKNIIQHSQFSEFMLLGQVYPTSSRIRFVVADDGIGIKQHITKKPYKKTHKRFQELVSKSRYSKMKSNAANLSIEEAAKYEVSGTDYQKNSGAGLNFLLKDLAVPTSGSVVIFSDNGYVRWAGGEIVESIQTPFWFPGTMISVTINCDPNSMLENSSAKLRDF